MIKRHIGSWVSIIFAIIALISLSFSFISQGSLSNWQLGILLLDVFCLGWDFSEIAYGEIR